MIIDNTLVFSDSQAITADAGSTNIYDSGAAGTPVGSTIALEKDVGKNREIAVAVQVMESFNTLTSLAISYQVDNDVAFGSPKTISSRTYLLAELVVGARLTFPAVIPEGADERYHRLHYDVTGTNPTLGKIFAAVVAGRQTQG